LVFRLDTGEWDIPELPDDAPLLTLHRAVLVDHLADCLSGRSRPMLNLEHARHVLEIMLKADESARSGRALDLTTTFSLPEPSR
jgi:predicted dehydrogenase